MGKTKKPQYLETHGKKVNISELTKMVNKTDKDFKLDLKHPDIWGEPEQYRQIFEAKSELFIAAMVCTINGIDVSDYFETDYDSNYGTICKPVGIMHPVFTDASCLQWTSRKKYHHDSLLFRCRFLTLVLTKMMYQVSKITDREVTIRYKLCHSRDEKRIILTKDIIDDLLLLTKIMIHPNKKYQNIILKVQEHMSYSKKKTKHRELQSMLNRLILNLRSGIKPDMFTKKRLLSDDMIISDLLKISYVLATNNVNIKQLPKFKHIEGATVKHDLLLLITELGDVIMTDYSGLNPMFKCYIKSRPSLWSQFAKEATEDRRVQFGLLALGFSDFVINDKYITKFIHEMMQKGI